MAVVCTRRIEEGTDLKIIRVSMVAIIPIVEYNR